MINRLRGALGLDAVVPVVLIAAALLMTLDPTMLGVAVSERQIVLAFFGFLGIDTLIERTGRLRRPLTQRGLRQRRHVGRAVDSTLGAGEGSDAIRVARLGYAVDAIEVSAVACEKSDSPVPRACASPCGASRSRPPGCRPV
jgi:hypothetical protein